MKTNLKIMTWNIQFLGGGMARPVQRPESEIKTIAQTIKGSDADIVVITEVMQKASSSYDPLKNLITLAEQRNITIGNYETALSDTIIRAEVEQAHPGQTITRDMLASHNRKTKVKRGRDTRSEEIADVTTPSELIKALEAQHDRVKELITQYTNQCLVNPDLYASLATLQDRIKQDINKARDLETTPSAQPTSSSGKDHTGIKEMFRVMKQENLNLTYEAYYPENYTGSSRETYVLLVKRNSCIKAPANLLDRDCGYLKLVCKIKAREPLAINLQTQHGHHFCLMAWHAPWDAGDPTHQARFQTYQGLTQYLKGHRGENAVIVVGDFNSTLEPAEPTKTHTFAELLANMSEPKLKDFSKKGGKINTTYANVPQGQNCYDNIIIGSAGQRTQASYGSDLAAVPLTGKAPSDHKPVIRTIALTLNSGPQQPIPFAKSLFSTTTIHREGSVPAAQNPGNPFH